MINNNYIFESYCHKKNRISSSAPNGFFGLIIFLWIWWQKRLATVWQLIWSPASKEKAPINKKYLIFLENNIKMLFLFFHRLPSFCSRTQVTYSKCNIEKGGFFGKCQSSIMSFSPSTDSTALTVFILSTNNYITYSEVTLQQPCVS